MEDTHTKIVERLKEIRLFQPSTITNSVLMAITQFLSFIGASVLIIYSIILYFGRQSNQQINSCIIEDRLTHQAYLMLVIAFLLLVIWKLTCMVRNRNRHILDINDIIDNDAK